MQIEILRRRSAGEAPYVQRFWYEPEQAAETVATALTKLGERSDLRDAEGASAAPIRWECSCLQKKCGACAMVINGRPGLACNARLSEYKNHLRLEPLRKFPVVADLIVDRSALYEALATLRLWFEGEAAINQTAAELGYEASRCLQCGCCLEVCPNYMPGGKFAGMAGAVPMARLLAEAPASQMGELSRLYRNRVFEGCGKSMACRNICPAGIPIDDLLVNSNAIAVWKRLLKKRRRPMFEKKEKTYE